MGISIKHSWDVVLNLCENPFLLIGQKSEVPLQMISVFSSRRQAIATVVTLI